MFDVVGRKSLGLLIFDRIFALFARLCADEFGQLFNVFAALGADEDRIEVPQD